MNKTFQFVQNAKKQLQDQMFLCLMIGIGLTKELKFNKRIISNFYLIIYKKIQNYV